MEFIVTTFAKDQILSPEQIECLRSRAKGLSETLDSCAAIDSSLFASDAEAVITELEIIRDTLARSLKVLRSQSRTHLSLVQH